MIISILSAAVILLISCKMQAQNDNSQWAIVNVSDAFLRAEPRYTSECVSQTRMGTLVQVLERKGYWVRIQTPEPYEGWVNELALAPTRELSPEEQKASKLYGATLKPMTAREAGRYLKSDRYIVLRATSVKKDLLSYGADNVITTVQMGNIVRAQPSRCCFRTGRKVSWADPASGTSVNGQKMRRQSPTARRRRISSRWREPSSAAPISGAECLPGTSTAAASPDSASS